MTRVVSGAGSLAQLPELVAECGGTRALLVTDPGIVAAGHLARASGLLTAANIAVIAFTAVHENPTTEDVDACLALARPFAPDILIGLGGGSSLDTAKGVNFLLTNGGILRDYWHTERATEPFLPLIAIPTTAGTGSEVQRFALIADATTHQKMAIGDLKAAPAVALLDPELTLSCPASVTANVGMDAIVHAVESYVTTARNEASLRFARDAYTSLSQHFATVLTTPTDLEARGAMLEGAMRAGRAIEQSMLGAAHSAANPLTAHFGVVHGQAVGVMLPHIVRFNAQVPAVAMQYAELAGSVDTLLARLTEWLTQAQIPHRLRDYGVTADAIPQLATEAAGQWTARFNPRPITADDFARLYSVAL